MTLGLARIAKEGSPIHPEDLDWECDLDICKECRAKFERQLKAYNDYWNIKDENLSNS